jgi:hypothetical protein
MLQATRGAQLPIVSVCTRLPETAFASATIYADTGAIPATLCHRQHATNDRTPVDGGSPDCDEKISALNDRFEVIFNFDHSFTPPVG